MYFHNEILITNDLKRIRSDMKNLLTVRDLAKILNTKESGVYDLCKEGKIPGVIKLGERRIRFAPTVIERWIETGEMPQRREAAAA